MRRRSLIDLTPLLDVILLLVFGFMFVLASTNSLLFKAEEELDMSSNEYAAAIESLNEEIDALEKKVIVLEEANSAGEEQSLRRLCRSTTRRRQQSFSINTARILI